MSVSKGSAQWTGNIKGKGVMKHEDVEGWQGRIAHA